jgi:hypothetical protein
MDSGVPKDLTQNFGCTINYSRLSREARVAGNKTDNLDHASNAVEVTQHALDCGERIQSADAGIVFSIRCRDKSVAFAHLAGRRKGAGHHRELTGGEDEISVNYSRSVSGNGGHKIRDINAEFGQTCVNV